MFELYFRPRAFKILKEIERKTQLEINAALDNLKLGVFRNYDIKKIRGAKFGWRFRLGHWRILFTLFSEEKRIEVVDIFFKKR